MIVDRKWCERRDEILRHPTSANALELWANDLVGAPDRPEDPLVAIHLARTKWLQSTPEMIEESRRWLAERGILPVFGISELNN